MERMHVAKRQMLCELECLGLSPVPSHCGFFLLPLREPAEVRARLLRRGLVVRSCDSFGIEGHVRIAVHEMESNRRLVNAIAGCLGVEWVDSQVKVDRLEAYPTIWDEEFRNGLNLLFRRRRDVRAFRKDALPAGAMERWIEAACLAPSVGLSQPWRFVSVASAEFRSRVVQEFELQNEAAASSYDDVVASEYRALKLSGLREAPEHLAVFVELEPQQGRGLGRATMPESVAYSVVAAIQNFWLAARSEGVGVGWVSILRPEEVSNLLEVPKSWQLIAYLCVGYPEFDDDETPELERRGWEHRVDVSARWRRV
jgi:5,6-dimethylbenzimidazole synthase